MRSRINLFVIAALTAALLIPGAALAEEPPIYLSLGTSLAAGTIADESGANIFFSDVSYTDQLHQRLVELETADPNTRHVKLGCPGETTMTFVHGGICDAGGPLPIYSDPQLDEALTVLATGRVDLVTIDLGANDIIPALPQLLACGGDVGCVYAILDGIAADVAGVVETLHGAAPTVPMVVVNYYNPYVATWSGYFPGVPAGLAEPDPAFAVLSDQMIALFNQLLAARVGALGIPTADVYSAFGSNDFSDADGDGVPTNVENVCDWTSMCPDPGDLPNIHADKKGYKIIAKTILRLLKS